MLNSRLISISFNCPVDYVYRYLSDPANLPSWTATIGAKFDRIADRQWHAPLSPEPEGPFTVVFSPLNEWGILDIEVRREGQEPRRLPARVYANGEGCDLVLTYFQRPGLSEEHMDSEVEWVRTDLLTVKALLETWHNS